MLLTFIDRGVSLEVNRHANPIEILVHWDCLILLTPLGDIQ
jgi:hypothetical protein